MFENNVDNVKATVAQLVIAASLFCIFFGEGTHFHDLAVHIGDHFDVHVHLHAHESNGEPSRTNSDQDNHQHEVSTASEIIGTLTSPLKVKPDVKAHVVISLNIGLDPANQVFDEIPTLFDLPPPEPVASQYYLSSFSYRGPPIA